MTPPSEHALTLRQIDQARTDFALIEDQLEFIASQLAKQPTRGDLAKSALGIIFCMRYSRHCLSGLLGTSHVRRSRLIGQLPGRKKLKTGSRLLVSRFPEIKFILSCCGVL